MNTSSHFLKGFFIGLITPVISFYFYTHLVLKSEIEEGLTKMIHSHLLTQVIALNVLANILPIYVFNKRADDEALKDVLSASVLYALILSILYFTGNF